MKLSKDFTLAEFTSSHKADELDINNMPNNTQITNLKTLVERVIQPARDGAKILIRISSGFRCSLLNSAIGGADTSDHTHGKAADLQCANNKKLFDYIMNNLTFDQLIWELGSDLQPRWIHVSYRTAKSNRNQVLKSVKKNSGTKYIDYEL